MIGPILSPVRWWRDDEDRYLSRPLIGVSRQTEDDRILPILGPILGTSSMEDNIMAQFRRKLAIVDSIPVLGLMRPGAVLDFLEFLPVDSLLASRGIPHDGMKETLSVGLAEAAFPLPSKSNHKPGARDAGYKPSPPVPKWAKKRDR